MATCGCTPTTPITGSLFDNLQEDLQTIENVANSQSLTTDSRLSGTVRTLQGRLAQISGFTPVNGGVWASAISFTAYDQYAIYNDAAYKVIPGVALPVLSTGTPDVLSFEPFDLIRSQTEINDAINEFNAQNIGEYTDYVFATPEDMIDGIAISGEKIDFQVGQYLKVAGPVDNLVYHYIVDATEGLQLYNCLFAKELFARSEDLTFDSMSPFNMVDPQYDAMRSPFPAVSIATATSANLINRFGGAVLSQANKIYSLPNLGTTVFKLNPSDGNTQSTIGTVAANQGYRSGALATNGIIYAASVSASNILKIDTFTDTVSQLSSALASDFSYDGAVAGVDGFIYFIPYSATMVARINPATDAVSYMGSNYGTTPGKFAGGCVGPNGMIYAAPHDGDNILEINVAAQTTRLIPVAGTGAVGAKYKGCVVGRNGKIYFVPHNATRVMIYDIATDSYSFISTVFAGGNKWLGGVSAKNGRIYMGPYARSDVLEINTLNDTVNTFSFSGMTGVTKFAGLVQTVDGIIFGAPSNAEQRILTISGVEGRHEWQISGYANHY